ncbi:MAG: divalent-cation tolerance protein CutA [Patescibacteria group bacterium]
MENKFIQIQTAVPKKGDAVKIAEVLAKKKLSACTQVVGPVESTFRWKGKILREKEWLCLIKTKKSLYKKVEHEIKKIHPYEVPEIITTPIVAGSQEYLNWIEKEI